MPKDYDNALRQRKSLLPKITVNTLKIAGAILLTLYFFSTAVIQNGVLHVPSYTPQQLNDLLGRDPEAMLWAGACGPSSSAANSAGGSSSSPRCCSSCAGGGRQASSPGLGRAGSI